MIRNFKSAMSGAAALAIAGGLLFAGAGAAHAAAGDPTFETPTGNPGTHGSVGFYDAGGNQIYGGTVSDDPIAAYFAASGGGIKPGDHIATAYTYTPQDNKPADQWTTPFQLTAGDEFAAAGSTAGYPGSLANSTKAVTPGFNGGTSVNDAVASFPLASTNDPGILQVRILTSGDSSQYYSTDIKITGSTWAQVFPAPPAAVSTSLANITANPASPAPTATTSVALTSKVTAGDGSHPAGSVKLFDGSTDLGAATFNAATGDVSANATVAAGGSYDFKFTFSSSTPNVTGSSSTVLHYVVTGAPVATTTVISGPNSTTVNSGVTEHADVKAGSPAAAVPAAAGAVQFLIDGSPSGNPVPLTATGADFLYTPTAEGSKTITATFVPASGQNYAASTSATGVTVVTGPTEHDPDPQNAVVNVPAGTLVISTPYTVDHPFNLGDMSLDANGTVLSASAPFGASGAPAATDPGAIPAGTSGTPGAALTNNGVTITDTRAASTGWTASAQTTDFTGPTGTSTPINGDNLSFTGVTPKYLAGNAIDGSSPAKSVQTNPIDHFKSAKKSFATTTAGPGTVNITGVLGLTAPTSTQPGLYTATVTFTIA
ncbi:MAG: hypothetical protein QOK10_3232 [Pseudonocardiales bacterium]|nr:hypothetical protein [Pseudonocardiales bacterium]